MSPTNEASRSETSGVVVDTKDDALYRTRELSG